MFAFAFARVAFPLAVLAFIKGIAVGRLTFAASPCGGGHRSGSRLAMPLWLSVLSLYGWASMALLMLLLLLCSVVCCCKAVLDDLALVREVRCA